MKRILPGLLLTVSTLLLPGKEIVFSETFDQQPDGWTVTGNFNPDGKEFDKFIILPEGSIKEVSTTLVKKSGN